MRSRRPSPEDEEASAQIDTLLQQAADALLEARPKVALALAEEALKVSQESAPAMHMKAAALVQMQRVEEAHEAFDLALELDPNDPETLLAYADFMICQPGEEDRERIEEGLDAAQKGKKLSKKQKDDELVFEFNLLLGIGCNQLGDNEAALDVLEEALKFQPDSAEARLEKAIALFELCRFKDAKVAFEEVLDLGPEEPWAHQYLGLLAERRKEGKEAERRFARARQLSPDEFPSPVVLSQKEFDQAVEDAVKRVPEEVKKYLENVIIAVEDIPSDDDLIAEKPPLSPMILGVFRGTPVGERSVSDPWSHAPASIALYQKNLERFAKTREELIEQIGITLLHEVGHLVGLDEDDLWERGLD